MQKLLKGKGVKEAKKEVVKTAKDAKKVAKKVTAPARKMLGTGTERAGGAGYRQYTGALGSSRPRSQRAAP